MSAYSQEDLKRERKYFETLESLEETLRGIVGSRELTAIDAKTCIGKIASLINGSGLRAEYKVLDNAYNIIGRNAVKYNNGNLSLDSLKEACKGQFIIINDIIARGFSDRFDGARGIKRQAFREDIFKFRVVNENESYEPYGMYKVEYGQDDNRKIIIPRDRFLRRSKEVYVFCQKDNHDPSQAVIVTVEKGVSEKDGNREAKKTIVHLGPRAACRIINPRSSQKDYVESVINQDKADQLYDLSSGELSPASSDFAQHGNWQAALDVFNCMQEPEVSKLRVMMSKATTQQAIIENAKKTRQDQLEKGDGGDCGRCFSSGCGSKAKSVIDETIKAGKKKSALARLREENKVQARTFEW